MDEEPLHFCGVSEGMAEAVAAWRKRSLRWLVAGQLPGLSQEMFRAAVAEAMRSWSDVCSLHFVEAQAGQPADIVVTTGRIDRPGSVLAWSELPDGSDRTLTQKYDTSERYVVAERPGPGQIDLVAVCCHEFGHALGLEHAASNSPDLMAPTYQRGRRRPQPGDVRRMQALYGPPTPQVPVPGPGDGPAGKPIVIEIYGASLIKIPGYRVTKE